MVKKLLILLIPLSLNASNRQYYSFRQMPKIYAFLDTISFAEGTYGDHGTGDIYHGYKQCFANTHFESFKDHPGITVRAFMGKKKIYSSAAGRYQILDTTWDEIEAKLNLPDFSPLSQDIAALYLLDRCHAIKEILHDRIYTAFKKTNKIWASLPGSPYGQPTKPASKLLKFYQERLLFYRSNPNSLVMHYTHS